MAPYVAPPRLCAISLGMKDGLVVLGRWVAFRGRLAAVAKARDHGGDLGGEHGAEHGGEHGAKGGG